MHWKRVQSARFPVGMVAMGIRWTCSWWQVIQVIWEVNKGPNCDQGFKCDLSNELCSPKWPTTHHLLTSANAKKKQSKKHHQKCSRKKSGGVFFGTSLTSWGGGGGSVCYWSFGPGMSSVARSGIHSHSPPPHRHSHATGHDRRDSGLNLGASGGSRGPNWLWTSENTNDFLPQTLKMVFNGILIQSFLRTISSFQIRSPSAIIGTTPDSPKTQIAATNCVMESFFLFHHSYPPKSKQKNGSKREKSIAVEIHTVV